MTSTLTSSRCRIDGHATGLPGVGVRGERHAVSNREASTGIVTCSPSGVTSRPGNLGRLNTDLGIDLWHGAGAPACFNKRFRSLPPIGRAAKWDRRPGMPDQRARPDRALTKVRADPQHATTHIGALHGHAAERGTGVLCASHDDK